MLSTTLPANRGRDGVVSITDGDFSGGSVVKNPPAYAGDTGFIPDPGRFHVPRGN